MIIVFVREELNWLQSMLFGFGEEKWPGSVQPNEPDPNDDGVIQMSQLEHDWFNNLLHQVRECIKRHADGVDFDLPTGMGKPQHDFISKILIDYKNSTAGNYIFRGPLGTAIQEGGQFPVLTGSANSNFEGQGSFPENQFQSEANIFNSILIKLGQVVFNEIHTPGSYHTRGE